MPVKRKTSANSGPSTPEKLSPHSRTDSCGGSAWRWAISARMTASGSAPAWLHTMVSPGRSSGPKSMSAAAAASPGPGALTRHPE